MIDLETLSSFKVKRNVSKFVVLFPSLWRCFRVQSDVSKLEPMFSFEYFFPIDISKLTFTLFDCSRAPYFSYFEQK